MSALRAKVVAIVLVAVLVGGCEVVVTYDSASPVGFTRGVLTSAGGPDYVWTDSPGRAVATGPADLTDLNRRILTWPADAPLVQDGEACVTLPDQTATPAQQGVALRIRDEAGRLRAITVTKNIYGWPWYFNLHTWDTSRVGSAFVAFGQYDMRAVLLDSLGQLRPPPWHLCAKVVGRKLTFTVWAAGARPAEDAVNSRTVDVPTGWVTPGAVGWYLGHLRPGMVATLDELVTWRRSAPVTTTTTTTSTTSTTTTSMVPSGAVFDPVSPRR